MSACQRLGYPSLFSTLDDARYHPWRYSPAPALDQTVTATPSSQVEHPTGPMALCPSQNVGFRMSVVSPIPSDTAHIDGLLSF